MYSVYCPPNKLTSPCSKPSYTCLPYKSTCPCYKPRKKRLDFKLTTPYYKPRCTCLPYRPIYPCYKPRKKTSKSTSNLPVPVLSLVTHVSPTNLPIHAISLEKKRLHFKLTSPSSKPRYTCLPYKPTYPCYKSRKKTSPLQTY